MPVQCAGPVAASVTASYCITSNWWLVRSKKLMCIYWGHICIFISNMKFLSLILWLEGLCTDANNTGNDDTDNYARRTNHDYIGSFGRIPNEPKRALLAI